MTKKIFHLEIQVIETGHLTIEAETIYEAKEQARYLWHSGAKKVDSTEFKVLSSGTDTL